MILSSDILTQQMPLTDYLLLVDNKQSALFDIILKRGQVKKATGKIVTEGTRELSTGNALALEGSAFDTANTKKSTKTSVSNICQILKYDVEISGTALAMNQKEVGDQVQDRLLEFKRDWNWYLWQGTYTEESGTTPRQMRGILNSLPAGQKVSIAKDTFSRADFTAALKKIVGSATHLFAGENAIDFLSEKLKANPVSNQNDAVISLVTNTIVTSRGILEIVPEIALPENVIVIGNVSYVYRYVLRDVHMEPVAKVGDSIRFQIIDESTNLLLAPKAFVMITLTEA